MLGEFFFCRLIRAEPWQTESGSPLREIYKIAAEPTYTLLPGCTAISKGA